MEQQKSKYIFLHRYRDISKLWNTSNISDKNNSFIS